MIVHYYSTKRRKLKIKKHFIQVVNLDNSDYFSTNWTFPRHFLQKCEKQKKNLQNKRVKNQKESNGKKDSKETGWIELKNKGHTLDGKTTQKNSDNPRIFLSLFPRGLETVFFEFIGQTQK